MSEEVRVKKDCRFSRLCKSTRRGTWIDCSLGKGLICIPNSKFCKYEPYKIKDIKEVVICECQSLKENKECSNSLEQQLLQLRKENNYLTQQLEKAKDALEYAITFYKGTLNKKMEIDLGEWIEIFKQALKELEG